MGGFHIRARAPGRGRGDGDFVFKIMGGGGGWILSQSNPNRRQEIKKSNKKQLDIRKS